MAAALDVCKARGGGTLERWDGGFWTWPGCPRKPAPVTVQYGVFPVPEWWVGWTTVEALVTRELLVVSKRNDRGFAVEVRTP
jgi:hypothetical protein